MTGPAMLDGLKVIEIAEGIPGPMCGKVLTDLGAAVTRIEPPGGDWLARAAPAIDAQLNAGKTAGTLDLKTPADQAKLHLLAAESDLAIVGHRRSKLPGLGLAYAALQQIAPRLVYCHLSGWGSDGPRADAAASELSVQVVAGLTRYLGTTDAAPVRQGFDLVSVSTGVAAAQAGLAALLWRERSGQGQYVEVSMLATAVALMQWSITAGSGPDTWDGRQLCSHDWPPDHGFQCADTRCLIDLRSNEEAWPSLLRDIGCTDLAEDPRFATRAALDLHGSALPRLTAPRLSTWAFTDLEALVRDTYDGTIVPMLSLPEVIRHPQIQHLGLITGGAAPRIRFPMDLRG
ncbi:MAG: CaiB/BaiF CoA-transferase family protein [Acetobacteraceae bacterium]